MLLRHPYALLFALVLVEQMGLPLPTVPVLLGAGALAGTGALRLPRALAAVLLAALAADLAWYELARRRGARMLRLLCRISLEPDSCVRQTENLFGRFGPRALLFAKFVPGLGAVTTALAGAFGLRRRVFVVYDALGVTAWAGAYLGLGYAFSDQLAPLIAWARHLGAGAFVLLVVAVAAWIAFKYTQRRRFIRDLRIARIAPDELLSRLDRGEDLAILDLRHPMDFEADPRTLPGALRMAVEEVGARHGEIPRDREVVLYCT